MQGSCSIGVGFALFRTGGQRGVPAGGVILSEFHRFSATALMTFIADLHIHSRYAYATSKRLSLENLACWAKLKGIDLLACADFTHPAWFTELRQKLEGGPAAREHQYRAGS